MLSSALTLGHYVAGSEPIGEFKGPWSALSNFSECGIRFKGITYPTVEHAYQAMKTRDVKLRRKIARAATPGIAKRMGRDLDLRSDWEEIKLQVMEHFLRKKFKLLANWIVLLATERRQLIEGNRWGDRYWGVCLKTGKGQNWLGRLLMKIRSEVCRGVKKSTRRMLTS